MYSFQPGPAQLHPLVPQWTEEAFASGILAQYHRSEAFREVVGQLQEHLPHRLGCPPGWQVLTFSSATEFWTVLAQAFGHLGSVHVAAGAFGQRWFQHSRALGVPAQLLELNVLAPDAPVQAVALVEEALKAMQGKTGLLALTHNETSTASTLPEAFWTTARPDAWLVAADATSSMAAVPLPWQTADLWFASVQKGFGLPAGAAVALLSPRAQQWTLQHDPQRTYNSLAKSLALARQQQTTHTPNMLAIWWLMHWAQQPGGPDFARVAQRAGQLYELLEAHPAFRPLVPAAELRSQSVVGLQGPPEKLMALQNRARQAGLLLGEGYGPLKGNSLRIANFGNMPQAGWDALINLLSLSFS